MSLLLKVDVRDHSGLYFFLFSVSPELSNVRARRELRRSSRHDSVGRPQQGTYGDGSAPLGTPSAAYLATFYRCPCGSQSARASARPRPQARYFRVLRFFGVHSASALSRRWTSWSSPGFHLLANSNLVAMGRSILSLTQRGRPSAQGHKGGDTSSHARCHQDVANAWRVSRAREIYATA